MNRRALVLSLAAGLSCLPSLYASHVRETLTLTKGWNAVYLESTPDAASCADFFAGLPVVSVGAYVSDAYSDTRQYRSDGTVIEQKPVSYLTWYANDASATANSLVSLVGGTTYLVYSTGNCTKTFDGVPVSPRMSWREASDDGTGLMNLGAPSLPADTEVSLADYYAEGPVGANGKAWQVGGEKKDAPTFLSLAFMGKKAKLHAGKGYMLTSERTVDWPGVVGLRAPGGAVSFDESATVAAASLENFGTTTHVFRVSVERSSLDAEEFPPLFRQLERTDPLVEPGWTNVTAGGAWEVELESGASRQVKLGLDRGAVTSGRNYAAVLKVCDLGRSQMQVRLPVTVSTNAASAYSAAYPAGLWIGRLLLTGVAQGTNVTTSAAAGTMKPTVILHVDDQPGHAVTLLQQVSVAQDTNGVTRLFRSFASAKRVSKAARRYSSLIVDPAAAPLKGAGTLGEKIEFAYAVAADSDCNPFRHAWHPDHDGVNANYDGMASDELWATTNTVTFFWKDADGKPLYEPSPRGDSLGYVRWRIDGLKTDPVIIDGAFALERVLNNSKLED